MTINLYNYTSYAGEAALHFSFCNCVHVFNLKFKRIYLIMNLSLKNKTALVCGGSQGIGLAAAIELALLGATVILASRNMDRLQIAVKQLSVEEGQKHSYLVLDLSEQEQVKTILTNWISRNGVINILINNAGGPLAGALIKTSAAAIETAFRTHVISSHLLVQFLLPGMQSAVYGRIINILSTSVKQPINGLGISNTVRAAVANYIKTLANEEGNSGITFNNILPGYTNTSRLQYLLSTRAKAAGISIEEVEQKIIETIPAKRFGHPGELGAVVAFICSPAAAYINGVNITVDGGRSGSL